jgi:signal transduction histidine kinase
MKRRVRGVVPPAKSESLARLYWSFVVSTALAALLVVATIWFAALRQTEDDWVRHTLSVRNQIARVLTLVQRAEAGQRGFLLTGREMYLMPYRQAVEDLPAALDELGRLVADNPLQQQSLGRIRQVTIDKLRELRSTVDARQARNPEGALAIVNNDSGERMMDAVRSIAAAMGEEEDRLLTQRQVRATTFGVLLEAGAGAALLVILAAAALGSFLTRRSFRELAAAHDQLVTTNEQLVQQQGRREAAESQLRQSQKMEAIGQLSGGIAHDFNNMLGVISGSLDLMKRHIAKGDFRITRYLDAAFEATKRSAALTHRLLAFARQQPLAPEPLDANRMITTMSDLLRSTLGEQVRIETVNGGGLWATKVDMHQLENAILNVAINARDAMPEGGRLTIETANAYLDDAYARSNVEVEAGQFVMIAISDTGMGMSSETIARAFDPFFTTKPAGTGTGLGLSQVFGFVKQSRGHIKIYSEVGAGTTVKIYLPRFIGDANEVAAAAAVPVQGGTPQEVILVVEDDPLMRSMTTESLRELGYTALHSENAARALNVLESRTDIALLFTDIVMPETNGKKLADEALRRLPGLKVIYTTGYTPNAVVHGGVLDPGVQLLTKPFTLEQLAIKIRSVLDKA